jgi:hypothetical protein
LVETKVDLNKDLTEPSFELLCNTVKKLNQEAPQYNISEVCYFLKLVFLLEEIFFQDKCDRAQYIECGASKSCCNRIVKK